MKTNCDLTIDKRLAVKFKDNGRSVIIRKDNRKEIISLNKKIFWLEKIEEKKNIKLVVFSCISRDRVYAIEEILIDIYNDKALDTIIALTKDRPVRLYKDVYKYRDLDNKLCILNLKNNYLTRIENNIKSKLLSIGLNVINIKLNSIENNYKYYELVIEIKNLEILHLVINIDNDIECGYKINNTIYSEYYNGLEFNVSNKYKCNEFISNDIFFDCLIKHQLWIEILNNNSKLLDNNSNVKTNIKTKILINSKGE